MYTSREVYEYISHKTNDPIVEWKVCKISGESFAIYQSDLEFYTKISPSFGGQKFGITTPTLCPEERQRRRLMFRNERKLYKRKCDFSGKDIISIYSPEKPYKVYDQKIWRSDDWDPMEYGKNFDFSKSFAEQFEDLLRKVPQLNVMVMNNENCPYTNYTLLSKNIYLSNDCMNCEDVYYSNIIKNLSDCCDITDSNNCSNLYQCLSCENTHNGKFLINCSESENCYYCIGLQNKKNYIFNKPSSPEEIQKILSNDGNCLNNFKNLIRDQIQTIKNIGSDLCFGNNLLHSNKSIFCFENNNIKNCKYAIMGDENMDCYDVSICNPNCSQSIELISGGEQKRCGYNIACGYGSGLYYSYLCMNSNNLFGCVGLRNKQYCIFNKQYSKEEYEITVAKIIAHMQETGEWGEFFDPSLSPFCYNETVAQEYFPLTREEALAKGYNRMDKEYPVNIPPNMQTIDAHQLPSDIDQVQDTILEQAIICEVSGKPYRIVKPELAFYRKHKIAIPRKHPDVRHSERMQLRPGRTLFLRNCDCCSEEMLSVYSQDHKGKVYCESCYQKEVYG